MPDIKEDVVTDKLRGSCVSVEATAQITGLTWKNEPSLRFCQLLCDYFELLMMKLFHVYGMFVFR